MSQLSRDLEAHSRQGFARVDVGARVEEAYLGLRDVLWDAEKEAIMLSTCEPSEEERLLRDQEIFIVGEE